MSITSACLAIQTRFSSMVSHALDQPLARTAAQVWAIPSAPRGLIATEASRCAGENGRFCGIFRSPSKKARSPQSWGRQALASRRLWAHLNGLIKPSRGAVFVEGRPARLRRGAQGGAPNNRDDLPGPRVDRAAFGYRECASGACRYAPSSVVVSLAATLRERAAWPWRRSGFSTAQ